MTPSLKIPSVPPSSGGMGFERSLSDGSVVGSKLASVQSGAHFE